MNKPSRLAPGKPSHIAVQKQMGKQNQPQLRAVQPKIATAPQRQPVAPPVYRPQPVPRVLQRKSAVKQPSLAGQAKAAPVAPPAYHPQPTPKVLQRKMAMSQKSQNPQLQNQPVAPPVYRPQPVPRVLQTKMTGSSQARMKGQAHCQAATPAVGRPEQRNIAQPKMVWPQRKPPASPRVIQRMMESDGEGEPGHGTHQMQVMEVMQAIAQQAYTSTEEQRAQSFVRRSTDGANLILSAPEIHLYGRVHRDSLPHGVHPADQFGWVQTIFRCDQHAYYDIVYHGANHRRNIEDYQALSRRLLPVPVRDGGEDPIFYDRPSTFAVGAAAALLGLPTNPSSLGAAMMDKPQDLYPLSTPDGFGVLSSIRSTFEATAWFVAVRGVHIVHCFSHCDWQVNYRAGIDPHGTIEHNDTRLVITSRGPGYGTRRPVMTGPLANEVARNDDWSIPMEDPLGLM